MKKEVVIYQAKSGAIELRGDFSRETIWATQAQIVELFDVDQSVVSRHINNIFKDKEISLKSNMQKMHIASSDRPVSLYSLDVILGVGYRTNSSKAVEFRRWATAILREHITEGFTINRKRIGTNYEQFLRAVDEIKHFLPEGATVDTGDVVELVQMFATTWLSLDAYDRSDFPAAGATRKQVLFTADELAGALSDLKRTLVGKKEAGDLFGAERARDSVAGIVGNVFQSFGGKDVYPTVEEKAAHLLYFVVKNHPFTDGNKRSGAFAFVWFLRSAKLLDPTRLSPEALTALTLLVAESKAAEKDRVIGLVLLLLKK
jgi:hypothetical protein